MLRRAGWVALQLMGWDDVATPKVLTITLEFEIGSERVEVPRLRAAYRAGINAAVAAVMAQMQPGNVAAVHPRVTWAYRWTDKSGVEVDGIDLSEWIDDDELSK